MAKTEQFRALFDLTMNVEAVMAGVRYPLTIMCIEWETLTANRNTDTHNLKRESICQG